MEPEMTEGEQKILEQLAKKLFRKVQTWNEEELKAKFIFPIVELVNYDTNQYSAFYDRPLDATLDDIRLNGIVDMVVATGEYLPEKPFFFLHEYKPGEQADGNPLGQLLAAMLAAQKLNDDARPVYGAYVVGRNWFFVVLENRNYAVSRQFDASDKVDVFQIFGYLKAIKKII